MNSLIAKRLPCSLCGLVSSHHDGWFLVIENRWLDRLKILSWHSSLATQKEIKSACSRQHLRMLIGQWLVDASLRLPPLANTPPTPIASAPGRPEFDLEHNSAGYLLGELSVHRETLSGGWTGSHAALEAILDALIPVVDPGSNWTTEYRFFDPPPSPHINSPFTKALADLRRCLLQV
ncbi:MAG: hypothetical protein WA172_10595 [Terriglobales bacterium]